MLLETHSFGFDEFVLDTNEKILLRRGEPVSITPKVYDLLYLLVENHGHLLEKEAIMDVVWADSFVEESNLTYTIRQLRKLLDDDARNPKFIETVSGRGYRFIAEVSEINADINGRAIENDGNESGKLTADKAVHKVLSKRYLTQRSLLLILSIGLLVTFGILSMNYWKGNNESFTPEKLSFKSLKTNAKSLNTAISPNGKYLAYTDESDEKVSLWLENIDTSEKMPILPPADVSYFGLAFSNDGDSIYFVRRQQVGTVNADIYKVSTLGGIPEKIITRAEGWISLSPDDKLISFVRSEKDADYSLYIADADGKNERKLITKQHPERIGPNQFSPDGKSIAFAAGQSHDGKSDFRLMKIDLENKIETKISSHDFFNIKEISWMPDGADLLMAASESSGKVHKIWRISSETRKAETLTDEITRYSDIGLDKAGEKLLAVQLKSSFQVSFSSFTNPNQKNILASASRANFISDGEIAYSTDDGELWKIDVSGKGQQQLTNSDSINNSALISPDGKYIYFKSNRSGSHQIWRMDSDGSNQIQITKKVGGFPKFVSSNRKEIIFESNLHGTIWKVAADGQGEEKEIWNRRLFYSAISDDGTKIAYLYQDELKDRKTDIEISDLKDKSLIQKISLAEKGMKPIQLAWLNDSKTLLYITGNESGYKLWKQKIDTDAPQFIADLGKERIRDFSVSPDGENFIIVSGEWLQDMILIEGFNGL